MQNKWQKTSKNIYELKNAQLEKVTIIIFVIKKIMNIFHFHIKN